MTDNSSDNLKLIRFKQRLSNFERAYSQLKKALEADTVHHDVLRMGLIQAFEFTFELLGKL